MPVFLLCWRSPCSVEKAQHIHARLKRTAEDIIAIGQDLLEVKARLGHGSFGKWLQSEFGMTDRHALNFMRVASRFGSKSEIISDLPITVLYELASPSMPETVVEMVEAGQIPATLPAIREAKQELVQSEQHTPPSNVLAGFGRTPVEMEARSSLPIISLLSTKHKALSDTFYQIALCCWPVYATLPGQV